MWKNEQRLPLHKNTHHSGTENQQNIKRHSFLKKDPTRRIPIKPSSSSRQKAIQKQSYPNKHDSNSFRQEFASNKRIQSSGEVGNVVQQIQIGKKNNQEENFIQNRVTFGDLDNLYCPSSSFLKQEDFQMCPVLYWLWRTEKFEKEIRGRNFTLRNFSKGRKEIEYKDGTIQILYEDIKLTRWRNGDFKLMEGQKVSFWSEQLQEIDSYFTN